jgi:septum site-determining protein MinD
MTRTILITSGKGGVGKTTLTSNLAYALTQLGENVIAMDANLTTPNLGMHFGMHLAPRTLQDVLKGKVRLERAIYPHPYGFKFIPASISTKDLTGVDVAKLQNVTLGLTGRADYVLMDCAAGLGREAMSAIAAADEILLVTNPDLPSVVVNRATGSRHELDINAIKELLELPVIAQIPEDKLVAESIAAKKPIMDYASDSPAAVEILKLAHKLSGRKYKPRSGTNIGILRRLINWMRR